MLVLPKIAFLSYCKKHWNIPNLPKIAFMSKVASNISLGHDSWALHTL